MTYLRHYSPMAIVIFFKLIIPYPKLMLTPRLPQSKQISSSNSASGIACGLCEGLRTDGPKILVADEGLDLRCDVPVSSALLEYRFSDLHQG